MGKHSAKGFGRKPKEVRTERAPSSDAPAPSSSRRSKRRGALEESPELPVHKERRRSRLKIGLAIAGLIVLASVLGVAAWSYVFVRSVEAEMQEEVVVDERVQEALQEPEPEEPVTILLLGSDIRPNEDAARADTIILARFDPEEKKAWLVSIPRDTRVDIPGYGVNKINTANYLGGPALMIETVEELMGVPINHYMEIDFKGFISIVDALGGVYVDVPTEIDDWEASSHSSGHSSQHIEAGYQLLDGEHALTFVRSRDYPDADFGRMRAQQLFFKALAKQSTRFENVFRMPGAIREFSKATTTDLGVSEILGLMNSARGFTEENMQTATLAGEWRSPYVYPDEERLAELSAALLEGGSIEEGAAVEEEETGVDPTSVTVDIRNGGGVVGIASEAEDVLTIKGFQIAEVGNANQFVYQETLVVFREEEPRAQAVMDALPVGKLVPSRGMYSFDTDVLVVVGKDWPLGFKPGDDPPDPAQ